MASQLLPLRRATRPRFRNVGTTPVAPGTTASVILPRVGYLAGYVINFTGVITGAAGAALGPLGAHALLQRIRLTANIGTAVVHDLSGWAAANLAQVYAAPLGGGSVLSQGMPGFTAPSADLFAAPIAVGPNNWRLNWFVPVSANLGGNFDVGLINLQAPETQVTVELQQGVNADLGTNLTITSGNWRVSYVFFEVPDPRMAEVAPAILVRLLEDQQPIAAQGENIVTIPRQGSVMGLAHGIVLNGVLSDGFDRIELRFNKSDYAQTLTREEARVFEAALLLSQPKTGTVYHFPMFNDLGLVQTGDGRDLVDSEELTTLESVVNITGALGAGNNVLRTLRRTYSILAGA